MTGHAGLTHAVESTNLADLLERILDKGIVIAGDVRVKLVEVELLTIEIRLVVCSVDRACALGLDWWNRERTSSDAIEERLRRLELGLSAEKLAAEKPATERQARERQAENGQG